MTKRFNIEVDLMEIIGTEKTPLTYSNNIEVSDIAEAYDFAHGVCDGEVWQLATGDAIRVKEVEPALRRFADAKKRFRTRG